MSEYQRSAAAKQKQQTQEDSDGGVSRSAAKNLGAMNMDHTSVSTMQTSQNACWENFPPNLFNTLDGSGGSRQPPKQVSVSLISNKRKTPIGPTTTTEERKRNNESILSQSSQSEPSLVIQESYQVSEIAQVLQTNTNTSILQLSSHQNSNEEQAPTKLRRCSDFEDDMNCEEVQNEEEKVLRSTINQKLIKNKNQFIDYALTTSSQHTTQGEAFQIRKQVQDPALSRQQQQQHYVMVMDKRSRSETPNKMSSSSDVLFRGHQKLQMRQKESPAKLLENLQQRQKKAEEVRTQIENSKKKWYEKTRLRQQIAKQKWKELLAERKRAFYDKLAEAEERRETEIEILRNKAKQEIEKVDETNYIVKMTMNNMKLDINNKMTETQERRNQIMEENKRKHHDRHLKEEAAEKRRQDLIREQESRITKQQMRRQQAEHRRNQLLEQKKRAAQEYHKRTKVLQRRNDLDKISDVMSFVNNSEFLWEFLGNENEWQDRLEEDDIILELIAKDQLEIQKFKLKRDAELLNKIIVQDDQGNIFADKQYIPLIQKINKRRRRQCGMGSGETSSSDTSDEEFNMPPFQNELDELNDVHSPTNIGSHGKHVNQHQTPNRNKTSQSKEESKSVECFSDHESVDREDSVADECVLRDNSDVKSSHLHRNDMSSTHNSHQVGAQILSDEAQNYMIYQIRMKMSMKRNILKKSMSEDLTWAAFLKNEMHYGAGLPLNFGHQARSLYSTPERRAELASEYEKDEEAAQNLIIEDIPPTSRTVNERHNKKRGARRHQGSARGKKGKYSANQNHSTQGSFQGTTTAIPPAVIMNPNTVSQTKNNISSSSFSDIQQRISSVVYPSSKKKNPKNEKLHPQLSTLAANSTDANQSLTSLSGLLRQKGGSNTSSTHSLVLLHQNQTENQKEGLILNVGNIGQGRRSLVIETDSGRKKHPSTARMNTQLSGSHDHSSFSGIVPQNIFNTQLTNPSNSNVTTLLSSSLDLEDKGFFDQQAHNHMGSQMITYTRPMPALSKQIAKKLTPNATRLLFPLCQQKLLLKRPGKDGQFGKFKVTIRIEELSHKLLSEAPITKPNLAGSGNATTGLPIIPSSHNSEVLQKPEKDLTEVAGATEFEGIVAKEVGSSSKSQGSTPINQVSRRKDSYETSNSKNNQDSSVANEGINASASVDQTAFQTPQSQPSKLIQIQQRFQENLKQLQSNQSSSNLEPSSNLMKKKNALSELIPGGGGSNLLTQPPLGDLISSPSKNLEKPTKLEAEQSVTDALVSQQSDQIYRDLLIRYLIIDNIQHLKIDDSQKTIFLELEESHKLVDYLEGNELQVRYCRLCETIIPESQTNEAHVQSKSHKKVRDDLLIKDQEDYQLSIVVIHSAPGDIEKELLKEKEKALKRKVKRIKQQMITLSVGHESAATCPGKDFTSTNRKQCQILCINLEKQVMPIIKDYDQLELTLKEIIKILDMRKQADLHFMRKLKFIPILIDICKRIQVTHKNEYKHLGKALDYVIKIINVLCGLRENRNYMLQTNRMSALIELLQWCLARPTQLFYGINFIPQLFHILTLHVKHRSPYECQQMKELFIDYLISSQITAKIKSKFQIINGPLDLSEMMGQVPLFLLKSANFLEALTSVISMDAINRPVYEKTDKIGDHVFFVIQNTELFGIVSMITTILLSRNQDFKPSQGTQASHLQKLLPQTILSLAITSIKIINHVFRMDYRFTQQIMSDFEIHEQLYHLINYILYYTVETAGEKQEDSKELLHETILMIGYFCLHNEKNQALLCKGESTIIQKLCGLPIAYFHDKKMKDILFPTLIQASYKNDRCLAIMDQEIEMQMLVNFINTNIKEELPKIIEEENDNQSMSSMSHSGLERRSHRSPSISSTNSSQCSLQIDMINGNSPCVPLLMRFPKKLWKDVIAFYSKVLY